MSYEPNSKEGITAENINYLGHETAQVRLLQRKRKVAKCESESQITPLDGNFGFWSNENCNFKLKRNKIRNSKPKRRTNLNLVKSQQEKPTAPHNTSQFLIQNFRNKENSPELRVKQDEVDLICITGGTMKGMLNKDIPLDLVSNPDFFLSVDEDSFSQGSTEASDSSNEFLFCHYDCP